MNPLPHSIAQFWDEYADLCVPENASELQRQETRRAFYGGVWSVYCCVKLIATDAVGPADAHAFMATIEDECRKVKKEIITKHIEMN